MQVTKTGDMIQFAVPDPQDPTGGKLIAIKFERKDLETLFTTTAGRRISKTEIFIESSTYYITIFSLPLH